MGKFDGVLLASDFDDTLCDGRTNAVPQRSLDALRRFMEEGGRFLVATGRAHRTFAPWAPKVPMNAPAVLSNGAAVFDFQKDELLWQSFLRKEVPEDCALLAELFPDLGFEAYHGEDIYVHNPNIVTEIHMKKVGCSYTKCPIGDMPAPWTKVIFQQSHTYLLNVQNELLRRWKDFYECIFSSPYLLELTNKGSTKGEAVLRVADMLGIRPEHVYCVGDNPNDVPMLRRSAIPFVPANASEEVKRTPGARVICSCADGAMGDIVDILDGIYR